MSRRARACVVGFAILSAMIWLAPSALPAYAWSSSLSTCVASSWSSGCAANPKITVGNVVYDTAKLTLTSDGAPYGTIHFAVAQGVCTDHGANLNPGPSTSSFSVTGSGSTYYTTHISTTGLSAGSYVWLVYYSGTGSGGYPRAPLSGYDCEPFTLQPPTHSVPEFPAGFGMLMLLAVPVLLVMRSRFNRGVA